MAASRSPLPKNLGAPARRALEAAGINSLQKAARVGLEKLRALHGVGPKALLRLEQAIEALGARSEVEHFLQTVRHSRLEEIEAVRTIILASSKDLQEHVKWNAPSFQLDGDDRITFRLQPKDVVQLVFHRGVKVRRDDFSFEDPSGLLQLVAGDRGVVTFAGMADVKTKARALGVLVKAWIAATR